MKVYRDLVEDGVLVSKEIFDIAECTYTGKDMGERSITATIYFATPIDFQIGDYIKLPMQNLIRSTSGVNGSIASGSGEVEKFYIYTMPTMKKVARAMENGKAFEHTVTFYPAQYELSCVQMRDLGNSLSADEIIYTGFDSVSFNGGAKELMDRIMMVLKEAYHDSEGNPLWSYEISDSVNEEKNLALERFPISFSSNTVMDALLELNNKETINTTFFINNRKIYVGFKRPYFCRVTDGMSIDTNPSSQLFTFQYGKTSDKGVALQYGGLYDITKTVGKEVPITKLFAYGASRNLNRYYCSDRVKGGRYVNRLMLPSFDTDGKTDFIISEEALQRYGVREATKQFEEIYPSIRYATYGDIRQVKYCIKVKASGVKNENIDNPSYPVARIQCYKIVEGEIAGVNKLVEAAPPDDLAIYIHAMDKVVKVVLYGGATDAEAISKQRQHDTKVPTYTSGGSDYIPGACFIVHDRGFDEAGTVYENANRSAWFTSIDNLSGFTEKQKEEIKLNQINYTDTFWLTDLYIFQEYNQTYFSRDGYSAWSWARLNSKYTSLQGSIASDSVIVNEIVHVEPITLADTSMTAAGIDKPQSTFDIYLRDLGFTINEQNDFGEMVFILNGTVKVSILDGLLAGQEFEISGSINSTSPSCICAFNDDGTRNEAFFAEPDYTQDGANPQTPYDAFNKGAIWRVRLNRTNVDDPDYSNLNLAMPTKEINAKSGDHLVLLDLFMPDIYIHAAENRLLREARKYLEANDNGSISYAVNFDKVRLQQIPNYAMQLREGLNLRVVDEDLNIRTENNGRYIADYRTNPIYSQRELADGKNSDWVSTVAPIDFTRSKHYTIELSIFNSSEFDINDFKFALFKTKNDNNTSFEPEYSVEQTEKGMEIILTIKFQLPDNFDDGQLYYPSAYLCKLKSWYNIVDMYLISVFERDYAENEEVLNYADFTIDSLTVKITDNSGNNEPIREITATLSEQQNATAWSTLMNKVSTVAKEGEQNKKVLEEVANNARKYTQALAALKNSIFDPDGNCDQEFLQVMMQQIGADSMNYQLDNTRLSPDGTFYNCNLEKNVFVVYNADTLRHFVFTEGSQAGNWEVTGNVSASLDGTSNYFICIKCKKNDNIGEWVVSTKQYAVNDPKDDSCYYFNWGILTVDSGGVYTLMETRGNAYMYGDNLVCGKISTLAGNSYFDLTHGDFVLGDGTGTALSYIDGKLTISGSKGDAEETLRQLGILQGDVDGLSEDLSAEEAARKAAIEAEEAARQAALKAIQEQVAAEEEARTEAIAGLESVQNSLQAQIDGEVTSWFMKGEPTTTNLPASDWTGVDENGVAFDYRQRHEGDTYTDISEITLLTSDMWEQGGYATASGNEINNNNRYIRTKDYIESKGDIVYVPNGYEIHITYYDNNKVYKKGVGNIRVSFNTDITYKFYRLTLNIINQTADISPSLADDLKLCINPTAGQSWRWCNVDDEYGTGWHWHKIADSDAVKALQEAAKAQATADGKSTIFSLTGSNKPTNYQKGDMWILQSDTIHTAGKKGDILNANADSATYVASHWTKEVSYIDESVAQQQAQQALDGLELGGENLVLESKGDSNKNIRANNTSTSAEFQYSCTPINYGTYGDELKIGLTCSTQGKYAPDSYSYTTCIWVQCKKETIKGKKYTISFDARLLPSSSADNCTVYFRAAGTGYSTTQMGKAVIDKTKKRYSITVDSNAESDTNTYSYFTLFLSRTTTIYISNVKVEQGNKATGWSPAPEDVDSKAEAIQKIANEAKESAIESNAQLANMSNDSILTPQEKGSVANEWACIQEEYLQNESNKESVWGNATVTEWTAYNTAYTTLQTYVETLALTDRANNTTIVKSTFQTNFANYYSANVAFLNALSKKVAELEVAAMEIGGRNLLRNSNVLPISQWGTSNATYVNGTEHSTMKMNVSEVMSTCTTCQSRITDKKWKDKNICISVAVKSSKDIGLKVGIIIRDSNNTNISQNYYNMPYINVKAGEWTRIYSTYKCAIDVDTDNIGKIYLVIGSSTTCSIGDEFNIKNWKIEFGNKATDWTPAPEDVDAAIEEAGYVNIYEGGDISKSYIATDYVKSQVLCSIYSGTYKTSAVENNGYGVNNIDPFNHSTLVVCKAGKGKYLGNTADLYYNSSYILGTYNLGNDITVAEGADIVIFFAQNDYIDYCISVYNEYGQEMPSGGSGTWTIRNIKIMTDNASAIKIAQSKAEALDYLKAALTDGSTEIAGGLTMTNVLMLKNLEGSVTAGMSGLTKHNNKEDKVLFWGGATYEEAYAAANNDTYNTGSGTITTLIKKDGTGKIGIFRISDTQAVVKTNQGEVLIDGTDNNGGVYVKNKSGKIKAAIVNGKVEDYAPLNDEVIINKTVNIKSDTYNNGVFAEGSSGTCTTQRSVTFNLKQYISVSEPCYCKVSVKVYGRLTQGFYNTEYKYSSATIQFTMNGEAKSPLSNSIFQNTWGYAQNGISPGQYYMEISRPIQSPNNPMATYNNNVMYLTPNKDFEVKVDVKTLSSGAWWCLAKLTGDLTFVIEVTRLWSYGYEPKTIVSTDGVMSAYDNKKFFIVRNTENGQKIYAKGLSNGADREAGSGELYVTSSFVDAFVSFLDEFYSYVDHVRSIGSNAGNADDMQTKIKGIKNTLVDASGNRITDIIASS